MGVTRAVIEMDAKAMKPRAIRAAVDAMYSNQIDSATPTPYPPEDV
jgi:transposase-like protein